LIVFLVLYLFVKLFIVRHGSTNQLENEQRQTRESNLSLKGLKQIEKIGQRLVDIKINLFFISPLTRAVESADLIAKLTNKKYVVDKRLREVDHPEKLYGASLNDEIVKKYDVEKLTLLKTLDWKFLDKGESLRDVIDRVTEFKNELINKHIDKNILVVSHAYAIRCLIASCIMGDKYTDEAMLRTIHAIRISKASLSKMEYLPENKYFYINLLNDTTHLDS